jgi:hypothetical protein
MRYLILLAMAACGTSRTGPTATVYAFDGDLADPAATVIVHRPNGEVFDQVPTDASGRAEVLTEPGALVSIVFSTKGVITVVTTLEPEIGSSVVVHGPPQPPGVPLVVGAIQITPAMPLAATNGFDVSLGCVTAHVTALPATIGVPAACLGSDQNLDVLVRGYDSMGNDPPSLVLTGYAAARVPMIDGAASFSPAQWETTNPTVPATVDAGPRVYLDWTLFVDGLPFESAPVNASGALWTGLAVDGARVNASIAPGNNTAQVTKIVIAGAPTAIHVGASDFLAALTPSLVLDDRARMALHWTAANIGDAVDVHMGWQGPTSRVNWDVVLPPDTSSIVLPIDAGTAPVAGMPLDVLLRYVDSTDLDGFTALTRDELHVEETIQASTIAHLPASGELRVVHEIGNF